jgi:hypothetical protein
LVSNITQPRRVGMLVTAVGAALLALAYAPALG